MRYIYSIVGICGGLALIIGSIKGSPNMAGWSGRAMRLAGFIAMIWGFLIIAQLNHIVAVNTIAGRLIQVSKTFIGGMGVGILITLFLSGELSFKRRKIESK